MKIDLTEAEVGFAQPMSDWGLKAPQKCLVVVSGPDEDGEISLLTDGQVYLPAATARALAIEILKRLDAADVAARPAEGCTNDAQVSCREAIPQREYWCEWCRAQEEDR